MVFIEKLKDVHRRLAVSGIHLHKTLTRRSQKESVEKGRAPKNSSCELS
jgi:hypothetical protein